MRPTPRGLARLALIAVLAMPSATSAQEAAVDESYSISSSGWTGATPARFILAWKPMIVGGELVVCGAFTVTSAQFRQPVASMLNGGAVEVNGEDFIKGLGFFEGPVRARREADMIGKPVRCSGAPVPAEGIEELRLRFGNGTTYG